MSSSLEDEFNEFNRALVMGDGVSCYGALEIVGLLPAGSAAGSSAGIVFTHGPILRFFTPQGRRVAPIKVKFGREERTRSAPPCQICP